MDKLLELIECPVCFFKLSPPIETCENGHAICLDCRAGLQNCPTCRGNFTESYNTLLNKIIEVIPVKCGNAPNGCEKLLPPNEKSDHEKICDYQIVNRCPVDNCNEQNFTYCLLGVHLKSHLCIKPFNFEVKCYFKVKLNDDNRDTFRGILYERTFRKVFSWVCVIDEGNVLIIGFQFVGKREKSSKYLYEVSFTQGHNITFNSGGYCMPYVDDVGELIQHPRSLKLDISETFFHNVPKNLNISFKIKPLN